MIFRAAEVISLHASDLTGVLWAGDKTSGRSEKARRNQGREANRIY